jgi:mono/diheme cytochrome c family protein
MICTLRREGFMFRFMLCVMALGLGLAVPAMAGDATETGEKIYAAQKCSVCHSIAGKGNAKGALDEVGSKLTTDEIHAWLTDTKAMTAKTKAARKPEMKVYTLPKEDIEALVAYLSAMKKK